MEEELDLIQRYIRGDCSEAERVSFKQRLDEDEAFRVLYHEEKSITIGIGLAERDRLKGMLRQSQKTNSYWWYAAAMIPILIVGSYIFFSQPNPANLYEEFYEPYGVYEFGMERGDVERDSLRQSAFDAYINERYNESLTALEQLSEIDPKDGYIFYQGACLIELENFEGARVKFERIADQSKYWQQSRWYIALIHLKEGNVDECRLILNDLADKKGGVGKRAKELLDEL